MLSIRQHFFISFYDVYTQHLYQFNHHIQTYNKAYLLHYFTYLVYIIIINLIA